MRRTAALAVAAALAAAVTVAGAGAVSGTQAAAPTLIRVVSTTTSYQHVDVKPKGASAGDHDTFSSRLVNERAQFGKPKGAVIGKDSGTLTYTSARTATLKGVARLPGGTLVLGGAVRPIGKNTVVVPVISGTGAFVGARGTLTILAPIDPKTAVNVYRLIYAPVA